MNPANYPRWRFLCFGIHFTRWEFDAFTSEAVIYGHACCWPATAWVEVLRYPVTRQTWM